VEMKSECCEESDRESVVGMQVRAPRLTVLPDVVPRVAVDPTRGDARPRHHDAVNRVQAVFPACDAHVVPSRDLRHSAAPFPCERDRDPAAASTRHTPRYRG